MKNVGQPSRLSHQPDSRSKFNLYPGHFIFAIFDIRNSSPAPLSRQNCRPHHSRIVAEHCRANAHVAACVRHGMDASHAVDDWNQFGPQRLDHPASQDKKFGVQEIDNRRDHHSRMLGHLGQGGHYRLVARLPGHGQLAAANIGEIALGGLENHGAFFRAGGKFADASDDGRPPRHRLVATQIATTASRAVGDQRHMPHLAGGLVEPLVELAVENQSAADSCANENANQIFNADPRPHLEFAVGPHVDIVLNANAKIQVAFEYRLEGNVLPPHQVGRGFEDSGVGVERTGRSHADGNNAIARDARFFDGRVRRRSRSAEGPPKDHVRHGCAFSPAKEYGRSTT